MEESKNINKRKYDANNNNCITTENLFSNKKYRYKDDNNKEEYEKEKENYKDNTKLEGILFYKDNIIRRIEEIKEYIQKNKNIIIYLERNTIPKLKKYNSIIALNPTTQEIIKNNEMMRDVFKIINISNLLINSFSKDLIELINIL